MAHPARDSASGRDFGIQSREEEGRKDGVRRGGREEKRKEGKGREEKRRERIRRGGERMPSPLPLPLPNASLRPPIYVRTLNFVP